MSGVVEFATTLFFYNQFFIHMLIELEDLKSHLMVEHNLDDLLLLQYEEVAVDTVVKHCNVKSINELMDENGELFPTIRQAILVLVGHFYQNREMISFGNPQKLPYSFEYLISLNQEYYHTN